MYDISKVFPNIDNKVLKEIYLHHKITFEEIINILCLNYEIQKNVEAIQKSSKTILSLNKYIFENEKDEHKEYIMNYKVGTKENDSRRPLKIDNSCKFLFI